MKYLSYMLLFFLTMAAPLQASDLEKEKRWAEQVEDALLDGDVVTLNDGENDFFTIYTPAEEAKKTGILLLHGIGAHPDWPQLVSPVRTGLPEAGWTTLSIQLPILPNEAEGKDYQPLMKEVPPRINAGIDYLKKEGFEKIIIIAHSMGAEMASYYLAESSDKVAAYVAIGMSENNTKYLSDISIPVLDLYGSNDLENVMAAAKDRKEAGSKNSGFEQKEVEGADHFFEGKETELVELLNEWLAAH